MTSTNPMGPFELVGPILKNPGWFFGLEGNNHHCMFQFMDQWYMAYHTRILEERMGILQNYRSTSIDSVQIDENGRISSIQATREGVAQTQPVHPYRKQSQWQRWAALPQHSTERTLSNMVPGRCF